LTLYAYTERGLAAQGLRSPRRSAWGLEIADLRLQIADLKLQTPRSICNLKSAICIGFWPGCPLTDDRVALKQRIKEANDIVDVVGGYIALRPAHGTFKGLCPFHDDQKPSFDVDPRRQRYKCWACGAFGDVIKFVQEFEHVGFREALELLARRAGITLEKFHKNPHEPGRGAMLDVMRWAQEQFQQCLLNAPEAEAARTYLGERRLTGDSVRRFGLGFAPLGGQWLADKAAAAKVSFTLLETLGLIAPRDEGRGFYDRFRDRIIFPIRDQRGQTVGFGGRILPSSPSLKRESPPPKYYNSAETPLFSKSDQLYGIDLAYGAAAKAGCLAVVEGYTDVMMAHQHGVSHVVATMGTALNGRHVKKIRQVAQRVVLVFDADAGGDTGVDRALEVFVSHDLDLRVATLPDGLDPCDLLVQHGPEPFQKALETAVDVLEYKLRRVLDKEKEIDGQRRATEQMLTILAASPQERTVKLELMVNRIAHRLRLKEEMLWHRLKELRTKRADSPRVPDRQQTEETPPERSAPAARHERELLELLLAEPALVARASAELTPSAVEHPGLRRLLEELYRLHAEGLTADLDHLHGRLDNERLLETALRLQDSGLSQPDRTTAYTKVLERFAEKRNARRTFELKNQVLAANDHDQAIELLARLRDQNK
jgi:DNA primase